MTYINEMRRCIGHRPLLLVGASVIAVKNHRILLQRRADNGTWGYPGGYMELGETPEEAARREFFEETGWHADHLSLFGVFAGEERHFTYHNGDEVYCTDIVYVCTKFRDSGQAHDEEVLEIGWFPLDDLPENLSSSVEDVLHAFVSRGRRKDLGGDVSLKAFYIKSHCEG